MLPKSYRLKKKEVERVYKKGKVVPAGLILGRFINNRAGHARFAIVIPKKISKKAADRNRLKRIIYENLSKNGSVWKDMQFDIVFSLKSQISEEKIGEIIEKILGEVK